jgi:predicted DNA-binding transcriptional regulator YafY
VAVLHFSAERARWVSGEVWHPEQTSTWLADGRYQLSVPYSDDRELLGDILRHGPHCVVASPPALRDKARAALAQALAGYDR